MIFSSESVQKKLQKQGLEEMPKPRTAGVGVLGVRGHKHVCISNGKTLNTLGGVFDKRDTTMMRNDKSTTKSHLMQTSSKEVQAFPEQTPLARNLVTLEPVSR